MAPAAAMAEASSMEKPHRDPHTDVDEKHEDVGSRAHPAQHEMLRRDIPKKDVAEALEEFDGDEN